MMLQQEQNETSNQTVPKHTQPNKTDRQATHTTNNKHNKQNKIYIKQKQNSTKHRERAHKQTRKQTNRQTRQSKQNKTKHPNKSKQEITKKMAIMPKYSTTHTHIRVESPLT